jgi:hypothetical protein
MTNLYQLENSKIGNVESIKTKMMMLFTKCNSFLKNQSYVLIKKTVNLQNKLCTKNAQKTTDNFFVNTVE